MRLFAIAASLFVITSVSANATEPAKPKPTEVMILGTYHFANPGKDVVNIVADDVTAKRRQRELEAMISELAKFKPDKILIEYQVDSKTMAIDDFRKFRPSDLDTKHNENYQIGYRLAYHLGHKAVYGFDEQPGEGEPDYFPLGKIQDFAKANKREADLGGLFAVVQKKASAFEAKQKCASIPALLIEHNDPDEAEKLHADIYYGLLDFGDRSNQAGAELNAYWYMRNAKMFAKIGLIAKPGARIFVLVGAGHKYWLDHFADKVPGFKSVDPRPYLRSAAVALPQSEDCPSR